MRSAKAPALPGMPGPTEDVIQQRQKIEEAIEQLHDALLPSLDALPAGDEAQGSISIRLRIKGDNITVTLKPGHE